MNKGRSGFTHHEKVGLWVLLRGMRRENLGAFQVFWKFRAQMGIFKGAEILRLGCVGRSNLRRLDSEVCFS